jgi:hypothetical protein
MGIQLFQLRLSPEQSGKVEYERERLLGIANKWMNLLAIPSSLSRSYSTFPLCLGDNLNWNSCILYYSTCKIEPCMRILFQIFSQFNGSRDKIFMIRASDKTLHVIIQLLYGFRVWMAWSKHAGILRELRKARDIFEKLYYIRLLYN